MCMPISLLDFKRTHLNYVCTLREESGALFHGHTRVNAGDFGIAVDTCRANLTTLNAGDFGTTVDKYESLRWVFDAQRSITVVNVNSCYVGLQQARIPRAGRLCVPFLSWLLIDAIIAMVNLRPGSLHYYAAPPPLYLQWTRLIW